MGAEFGRYSSVSGRRCCSCGKSRETAQFLQRVEIRFCRAACSSRAGSSSSLGCTDTVRALLAEYWSFWFAKIGSGTRILTKMGSCFSSLLGASGPVRVGSRRVPGSPLGRRAAAHSEFSGACSSLLLRTTPEVGVEVLLVVVNVFATESIASLTTSAGCSSRALFGTGPAWDCL